jgi:hypothetical protein
MGQETVEKGVLLTAGLSLVTSGASLAASNLPAGIVSVVAGFGCITAFIYLFEKQVVQKVVKALGGK